MIKYQYFISLIKIYNSTLLILDDVFYRFIFYICTAVKAMRVYLHFECRKNTNRRQVVFNIVRRNRQEECTSIQKSLGFKQNSENRLVY